MGCLVRIGQRRGAAGVDARGAGGAQPRRRGADLFAERASTSSGRSTTPAGVSRPRPRWAREALRMMARHECRTPRRTRIKICGLTREAGRGCRRRCRRRCGRLRALRGQPAGGDGRARRSSWPSRLPPFVTPVLLFVNEDAGSASRRARRVAGAMAQFHGDETPDQCWAGQRPRRPPLHARGPHSARRRRERLRPRKIRVRLLPRPGHPARRPCRGLWRWRQGIRLVTSSTRRRRSPRLEWWAHTCKRGRWHSPCCGTRCKSLSVDVSSGVEAPKGIKDAGKIREFVAAVRAADAFAPSSAGSPPRIDGRGRPTDRDHEHLPATRRQRPFRHLRRHLRERDADPRDQRIARRLRQVQGRSRRSWPNSTTSSRISSAGPRRSTTRRAPAARWAARRST